MRTVVITVVLAATALSACASKPRPSARADVATTIDPIVFHAQTEGSPVQGYLVGPGDKLKLTVFQVPDLSMEETFVDAAGDLQVPMIGSLRAAGQTPAELSRTIEQRLGERYLRNPQVVVTVLEAASEKVTVDGAVTKPGVYEMRGRTTLMQAVAMAEGPGRSANLGSVAVFRSDDRGRMVAVFDLGAIRAGQAPDPVLLGDDIVVVDTSRLNATMRDIIAALPAFAAFSYF